MRPIFSALNANSIFEATGGIANPKGDVVDEVIDRSSVDLLYQLFPV
jgi:hypothetical protein